MDFVGGMLGKGDGAYLTPSSAENLAELSPLAELLEQETVASKACSLRGLTAVTASGDYAGGLAGSLGGGQRGRLAE